MRLARVRKLKHPLPDQLGRLNVPEPYTRYIHSRRSQSWNVVDWATLACSNAAGLPKSTVARCNSPTPLSRSDWGRSVSILKIVRDVSENSSPPAEQSPICRRMEQMFQIFCWPVEQGFQRFKSVMASLVMERIRSHSAA